MRSNVVHNGENVSLSSKLPKTTWKELVEQQVHAEKLLGATCHIYSTAHAQSENGTEPCICGRLISRHSFSLINEAQTETSAEDDHFIETRHARSVPVKPEDYGQLENDARVC